MQPYGLSLLANYPDAWKIFLAVFVVCNVLTGVLYGIAKKRRLLPAIRSRDVHTTRKPRVGGVAMWVTALLSLLVIASGWNNLLNFGEGTGASMRSILVGIVVGMLILLGFGLYDDLVGLSPGKQLAGQVLAALALVVAGLQVQLIRLPFNHVLTLTAGSMHFPTWLGGAAFYPLSAIFTLIWIVTMINVMNFFDGLDGLAGSVAMTASVVLLLVSLRLGFVGAATLCIILFGVTAGFLPWNWYPSKIFMGTVGSQLLGFWLGVIAIISGAKVATAILVLGIPVFDALIVIIRRLLAHQSLFQADQRHLHHRLLKIGLSTPMVVLLTNLIAVTFGILALRSQQTNQKGFLTLILLICILIFILVTYLLERKTVKKVD